MLTRIVAVAALGVASCSAGPEVASNGGEVAAAPAPSQRLAPLPAPLRTEVVGAFWDGKVVVMGGWPRDGVPSRQVDFYDGATDSWSRGPDLPIGVHHAGAGVLGGRLYLIGGFTNRDKEPWAASAEVFSLGVGEDAWRSDAKLAGPRGALAVATLPDALVAIGGVGDGDLLRSEILSEGAAAWRPGPNLTVKREHLAAAGANGRAYAIAGREFSLESNRDSVESLAPDDSAWRAEPTLNDTRGGTAAAAPGGRPCVAGGEEPAGTIATIECLEAGRWEVVARLDEPRHGVAVIAAGDRLHVIGGGPKPGLFVSDTHEAFDL